MKGFDKGREQKRGRSEDEPGKAYLGNWLMGDEPKISEGKKTTTTVVCWPKLVVKGGKNLYQKNRRREKRGKAKGVAEKSVTGSWEWVTRERQGFRKSRKSREVRGQDSWNKKKTAE